MSDSGPKISRRSFLGNSIVSLAGLSLGLAAAKKLRAQEVNSPTAPNLVQPEKPQIKEYRALGRTGFKVSDVSFGNAGLQDPSLLEYAMERGINYVDTARQYYDMEIVIGKLFPAKRDKLFVTSKLLPELVTPETTCEQIETAIEESLERLNTDYIDCMLIHSVGEDPKLSNPKKIENQEVFSALEKAKKQGKIRAWGASSHGPRMVEDFNWLLDNTPIDMIMPGMNFMTKGLEPLLAKAHKKGVAIVAMKSLSAARKIDYKPFATKGSTIRQSIIKWMLAHEELNTVCITMRSIEQIDEYVAASGAPVLTPEERKALLGYRMLLERDYCRPGCSTCLQACPYGVPIAEILRYSLYYNSYGEEKRAITFYRNLPSSSRAERCAKCMAPCDGACPHGIAIRSKLVQAHRDLTV